MQETIEVGMKFGELEISSLHTDNKWNCVCSCGNSKILYTSQLVTGHNKSCGCLLPRHGMRKHRAYKSWLHMKQRCMNKDNQDYPNYGGRGLTVHEDFIKSFPKWLDEIGERPDGRWSIGRINNNLGYTYGNMRWETDEQQARNHSKSTLNRSGIVGVYRRSKLIAGVEYCSWIAKWANEVNKSKSKEFSCNKYGEESAKQMAIEYRNKMIATLNIKGFDYADSHGLERQDLNE